LLPGFALIEMLLSSLIVRFCHIAGPRYRIVHGESIFLRGEGPQGEERSIDELISHEGETCKDLATK